MLVLGLLDSRHLHTLELFAHSLSEQGNLSQLGLALRHMYVINSKVLTCLLQDLVYHTKQHKLSLLTSCDHVALRRFLVQTRGEESGVP